MPQLMPTAGTTCLLGLFTSLYVDRIRIGACRAGPRRILRVGNLAIEPVVFGRIGFFIGVLDAFFETLDGTTQIFADITQLFGTKNEGDNEQYDQPVPYTQTAHVLLLKSDCVNTHTIPINWRTNTEIS